MLCSVCGKNRSRLKKFLSIEVCSDCSKYLGAFADRKPPEDILEESLEPDGKRFLRALNTICSTLPRENAKVMLGICLANLEDEDMDPLVVISFLIAARSLWIFGGEGESRKPKVDEIHMLLKFSAVVGISVMFLGEDSDLQEEEILEHSEKNLKRVMDDLISQADEELKDYILDLREMLILGGEEEMEFERPEDSITRKRKKGKYETVYQFKISLRDIEPEIWRRIQVPSNYTFWDLHVAIQDAFGWQDCHLHEFEMPNPKTEKIARIGLPFEVIEPDTEPAICWERWLSDFFTPENPVAIYEYDFGDSWIHMVVLECEEQRKKGSGYPICLDGERAAPPEDCGGASGYEDLVEAVKKPKSRDAKEFRNWLGYDFDPEEFQKTEIKFDKPGWRLKELLD